MKICVIGGANVDITATSAQAFRVGDSNPGSVEESARWGLECARRAVESPHAVPERFNICME